MTISREKKSPKEIADEIINEFEFFDDWNDRYEHIIDLGKKLPPFDEKYKTEEYRLYGCVSEVHFRHEYTPPLLHFFATSDAAIVRGLIAILIRVYSGQTPRDILAMPPDFLTTIELEKYLVASRKNGLASFVAAINNAAQTAQK